MINFNKSAEVLDWTNGTGSTVTSGSVVVAGRLVGIAVADIANGAVGAVQLTGQFTLPKAASLAISVGDAVYWSGTAVTKTATDTRIGTAVKAALSSAATVQVLLDSQTSSAVELGSLASDHFTLKITTTGSNASPHVIYNANFPAKAELVDVVVQATATVSGGTVQLDNGTTGITNAIACATADAVTRAGTIAQATKSLAAGATLRVVKNATADSGIIYATFRRVP